MGENPSLVMTTPIEADAPATWQELEVRVATLLEECGYDVEVHKAVQLARGEANVDVWADDHSVPPNIVVVECKHWASPATRGTVHAFRSVVGDSGANTGILVSTAGFQKGAIEAAAYSNVRLATWAELQALYAERWYRRHMAPRLRAEADALIEYTEPINTRIARKEGALDDRGRERVGVLRERHWHLAMGFAPMFVQLPSRSEDLMLPRLPFRDTPVGELAAGVSDAILDATALRPLLEALVQAFREATAEFDQVFGERA